MDSVEHVLSFSYGKDSTACFGACEILGWKIDRVVTADLWATQTVPADHPLMVEYKAKADEIIKQRWGLTVEHCCAKYVDTVCGNPVSYEDVFYHLRKNGKFPGTIVGFPMRHGWCIKLKTDAIKRMVTTDDAVQYLGIAADEPERLARLDGISKVSPLAAVGWTEADCWKWCEENDLLSPIYTTSTRGGCWFCHNQSTEQLRQLRHNYPDLWALLLKWDNDSPVLFHADGHTVHDFDLRFRLEDEGLLKPGDTRFKWKQLYEDLQYSLF